MTFSKYHMVRGYAWNRTHMIVETETREVMAPMIDVTGKLYYELEDDEGQWQYVPWIGAHKHFPEDEHVQHKPGDEYVFPSPR